MTLSTQVHHGRVMALLPLDFGKPFALPLLFIFAFIKTLEDP